MEGSKAWGTGLPPTTQPHAAHVAHSSISLFLSQNSVTATSVSYNVEDETITLEFQELLHVGTSWILDITYIGLVNDKLNGFYRSVYTDADNNVQ